MIVSILSFVKDDKSVKQDGNGDQTYILLYDPLKKEFSDPHTQSFP